MHALIDISNQMLEDGAFAMEDESRGRATGKLAVGEGGESAAPTGRPEVVQCLVREHGDVADRDASAA